LKLKTRLRLNDRVRAIKLPIVQNNVKGVATLTGWGSVSKNLIITLPNVLQFAKAPILKQNNCADALRVVAPSETIDDKQFCTGPLDGTISACVVSVTLLFN
jgi:hypothetical protein